MLRTLPRDAFLRAPRPPHIFPLAPLPAPAGRTILLPPPPKGAPPPLPVPTTIFYPGGGSTPTLPPPVSTLPTKTEGFGWRGSFPISPPTLPPSPPRKESRLTLPMSAYARGGKVKKKDIGRPVVVGERGPEVVVPTGPAVVIPNEMLGAPLRVPPPVVEPTLMQPMPLPSLVAPLRPVPPVAEPMPVQPMPMAFPAPGTLPMVDPSGMVRPPALRSPQMIDTGDRLADLSEYNAELGVYRPQNNNSRLRSVLLGIGRGALLGGQGGLGGMLGGAAAGGLIGGFKPNMDEILNRDEEIARTQGLMGQEYQQQKFRSDMASAEMARRLQTAKMMKDLRPPGPDYERVETDQGFVYVDKNDPSAPPVTTALKPRPSVERAPQREWIKGVLHIIDSEGVPHPAKNPDGSLITDETRMPVKTVIGGQEFILPPPSAANALATQGREARAERREGKMDAREEARLAREESERQHGDEVKRWDDVSQVVGDLRKALADAEQAAAKVNNPPPVGQYAAGPEDVARFREEFEAAMQRVKDLGATVRRMDPDGRLVEDDPVRKFPVLLRPRPERTPRQQAPQAPSKRAAAVRGRSGRGRNYVAPRVSRSALEDLLR